MSHVAWSGSTTGSTPLNYGHLNATGTARSFVVQAVTVNQVGWANSDVASQTFTTKAKLPPPTFSPNGGTLAADTRSLTWSLGLS